MLKISLLAFGLMALSALPIEAQDMGADGQMPEWDSREETGGTAHVKYSPDHGSRVIAEPKESGPLEPSQPSGVGYYSAPGSDVIQTFLIIDSTKAALMEPQAHLSNINITPEVSSNR